MNLTGWLFDIYEDPLDGVVLWLLGDDGRRLRLRQAFPACLCARGPSEGLSALERFLRERFPRLVFRQGQRRDVFMGQEVAVLLVEAPRSADLRAVLREASYAFPRLEYADADLALSLRFAAQTGLFPLARCRLEVDGQGWVRAAEALDSPWDMDRAAMPLRVLQLEGEGRVPCRRLVARTPGKSCVFSFDLPRALLLGLRGLLLQYDPDLILAAHGDTWLMPLLLDLAAQHGVDLPLNRDAHGQVERRKERWYYSYGQLVYRGEQVCLAGRWHIDRHNAMLWDDYDLEGVFELARVTCLPVQTAARVSPGTGISAVQMLTALRLGILVPWQKQQAEMPRSAAELFSADQGGLVYQPLVGLHRDVIGLDFVSMYPAIMINYNISPETVGAARPGAQRVPELNLWIDGAMPGLVPQSLIPLLDRRINFKERLARTAKNDPQYVFFKKRAAALKWLLVTCFGYLGYKNARFGRIEAHQAVTAYGREALICAKEAAEDAGFEVIQMYVDGLWIQGKGDVPDLLDEILRRTGLPIAIEGLYRWVAFLPSRQHAGRAAANRYFGVFADGTLKVRGIEARRRDTPPFIAALQMEMLQVLASFAEPLDGVPAAVACLRKRMADLRRGRVRVEELLVAHKLGREPEEYKANSAVARAAKQVKAARGVVKPGQRVKFVYTLGRPGVRAWDQPGALDAQKIDVERYSELLLRAAREVLRPFTPKEKIEDLLFERREVELFGSSQSIPAPK